MRSLILFAVLFLLNTGITSAAQDRDLSSPAKVLVLGSYHFADPGRDVAQVDIADVLTAEKQAEISEVVDALAAFRPTKVAVERETARQAEADSLFAQYQAGRHELTASESQQLGFRLADRFDHDRVYAVDYMTYFPFQELMAYAQENDPAFIKTSMEMRSQIEEKADSLQRTATVREILRAYNRPESLREHNHWYLLASKVGVGDGYAGAELLSAWYARNVRIFANIAAVAEPGDRIMVIYGRGHAPILRELVGDDPDLLLVEPNDYL